MLKALDAMGRLVIPADIRRELGLEPGGEVQMWTSDGMLFVEAVGDRCEKCQQPLPNGRTG